MNSGSRAHAVMLVTLSYGKSDDSGAKPLSPKEWARFAVWLEGRGLDPSALLKGDTKDLLLGWTDPSVTVSRLERLLDRGGALGLALEKWERAGLWVITRSDPEYPERLKRRLPLDSPPVLFGCGNKRLLGSGGIAVVGSRDAGQDDIAFAENLGDAAAKQGYSIVSGGARGVDRSAMSGALRNEGTAVGVMADSLLRTAASARYRKHLLSGDLALITPFNPEAGFNVGNAMSRNRYIYCLADAAVVVSSTTDKGGTWNGALENLKGAWVPLWVKRAANAESGNSALAERGAHWVPDGLTSLEHLLRTHAGTSEDARAGPPQLASGAGWQAARELGTEFSETPGPESETVTTPSKTELAHEPVVGDTPDRFDMDFYALFLNRLRDITITGPMKAEDIALRLKLQKSQVDAWLKQGVSGGEVKKLTRPVRYQSAAGASQQESLFDDGN